MGGLSTGDPAEHAVDGRPADECFGDFGVAFVAAGQPTVRGEPGQGSLHDPSPGMHGEAALIGGFAHNLDGGLQRAVRPVDEPAGEALISKDVTDRAAQAGTEKGGLTAVAILPQSRRARRQ